MPKFLTGDLYIKWVKRALNLNLGTNLRPSAVIDDDYRTFVYLFKSYEPGLPENDLVDRPTNDALIIRNSKNAEYSRWARKSLADLVGTPTSLVGTLDAKDAKEGIRAFQRDCKLVNLTADGWVGAYTELAMVRSGAKRPPGTGLLPTIPKPPPPSKPKTTAKEVLPILLKKMIAKETDATILCVMKKLISLRLPYYLPPKEANRFIAAPFRSADYYDHLFNLRKHMESNIERWQRRGVLTPKKLRDKIDDSVVDMIAGVEALRLSDGSNYHCRIARKDIHINSGRSDSFYSCPRVKKAVDKMMKVAGRLYSGNVDRPF